MAAPAETVLSHYNLETPYPITWPPELDESDEDDAVVGGVRRSRSRYSALERSASDRRSVLPGSQKTSDGRANLVQKDEPDPLGGVTSVAHSLSGRGLPVDQDARLRNKFMLSSTTFSPALFLSQAHSNATTEDLLHGLDFLSSSIEQKSASLKVLVESNFERFVRAKSTIDNVYTEMRNQGMEQQAVPQSPVHSRQVSRSSAHFRNFSGGSATGTAGPPVPQSAGKNALRKETDYGVQGIKVPLLEVSSKAQEVWGPVIGGKEREAGLKAIMEAVEKDRSLYELGGKLATATLQKDYHKVVELYDLARTYVKRAQLVGHQAAKRGTTLTDEQIREVLATGRMWLDVEQQIKSVKRDIWRRLSGNQAVLPLPGASAAEEHLELITVLLELGVDDNPIWVWLLSRYDNLKNKITAVVDRSKIEIEIMRRRLAASNPIETSERASYLRQAAKQPEATLDSERVIELWEAVLTYLTKLLSHSSGLLGEVVEFWQSAKSFIEGHKQKSLPHGFEGQSRKHHRLSDAGVRDLSDGAVELVNMIRDAVASLLADPPIDDMSSLVSPSSASTPKTPASAVFSPTNGHFGKIDAANLPAASARKGDHWENFAFWPPHANALSGVHYLGKCLLLIATGAGEMNAIDPVASSHTTHDNIRSLIIVARERCVKAICEAWLNDAANCKSLEDWQPSPDRRDHTNLPYYFNAYEKTVITKLQQVIYFTEAVTRSEAHSVTTPPSSKLFNMIRTYFVDSMHKALNSMLENAEQPVKSVEDEWILVTPSMVSTSFDASPDQSTLIARSTGVSSRSARILLTLSNLKVLRIEYIPQLISLFESSFSVKLTEETKSIREAFGQVEHKLFQSYSNPIALQLTKIIKEGILSPSWVPTTNKPDQVRPYVYAAMMNLVLVHTEVTTTVPSPDPSSTSTSSSSTSTSSNLLPQILSYLLEQVSLALLAGFKERKGTYGLPALMQATLDTEFIAQTMSQYATQRATDSQSEIYMELDKRTNNESRARLQQELTDLRVVLKRLRESSRGSFGCFRRAKTEGSGGSGGGGKERGRPERKVTG